MHLVFERWLPLRWRRSPLQRKSYLLETAVRAELKRSVYGDIRQVTCQLSHGVLKLQGHVSSFYHKQIAQTVAMHVLAGAASLQNELEVWRASGSAPLPPNSKED